MRFVIAEVDYFLSWNVTQDWCEKCPDIHPLFFKKINKENKSERKKIFRKCRKKKKNFLESENCL